MKWLKMGEYIPKESRKRYLVWEVVYGQPTIGVYYDGKWHTDIVDDYSEVTHWMPLPDAPGAEDAPDKTDLERVLQNKIRCWSCGKSFEPENICVDCDQSLPYGSQV